VVGCCHSLVFWGNPTIHWFCASPATPSSLPNPYLQGVCEVVRTFKFEKLTFFQELSFSKN
jgi:hypothetical protein